MSLLPLLIKLDDELSRPVNRWSNCEREFDMLPLLLNQYYTGYRRHPRSSCDPHNLVHGASKSSIGKDGFQVCMNVHNFAPNEISVKTVDNTIVVEGNHEERQDEHGYVSRQFKRRYDLPKGFNIKDVVTQLSSDGILTIKAPPEVKAMDEGNVRVLHIQQTGPARLNKGNKESIQSKGDEAKGCEKGKK